MDFGLASYGLSFAAGVLSILSPCVLPLVPILLASAIAAHRFGALALALGLTLSFALLGIFLGTLGASIGLGQDQFRHISAVLFILCGIVLLSSGLQQRWSVAAAGLGRIGNNFLSRVRLDGIRGQFIIGLLLGLIWSPCVGPTLGAAITLASQGKNLAQIALLMAIFGLGAGLPLAILGMASRAGIGHLRGKLITFGKCGKYLMGGVMLVVGGLILSGLDRALESWLVDVSPAWLTVLTTSI